MRRERAAGTLGTAGSRGVGSGVSSGKPGTWRG